MARKSERDEELERLREEEPVDYGEDFDEFDYPYELGEEEVY